MPTQLTLEGLPLDPHALAEIPLLERAALYADLQLDPHQREAAEAAVRALLAGTYGRRAK